MLCSIIIAQIPDLTAHNQDSRIHLKAKRRYAIFAF